MLQAVAIGLLWLKDSLASTMFVEAWQKLASQVNDVRNDCACFYSIRNFNESNILVPLGRADPTAAV